MNIRTLPFNATLALALLFALSGCVQEDLSKSMSIKLDPGISKSQQQILIADLLRLVHQQIKAKPGSRFEKIFGGPAATDVVRYLDERINYVMPEDVDTFSRYVLMNSPTAQTGVGAENIGFNLWERKERAGAASAFFRVGNESVPVTSPRVGIIRIGEVYNLVQPVRRTAIFVHEARHSDCTGGTTVSELWQRDLPNLGCGNTHIPCPPGHPYEGLYACDGHPWGAYAVEGFYLTNIDKHCRNCNVQDRVSAGAQAIDAFSRVLVLKKMITGELGDPDMSSTGVIDEATRAKLRAFREQRHYNPQGRIKVDFE